MSKHKTTKLPHPKIPDTEKQRTLPYNGSVVSDKGFSFSFACFDRQHKLFNLGCDKTENGIVSSAWFLELLDCLKEINNKTFAELKGGKFDLHPVSWNTANTPPPNMSEQLDFWQFRINKAKGRVVGFILDSVFYIVWLDPHHNLTDSEGYGGVREYTTPLSEYELLRNENKLLKEQVELLKPFL